MQIAVVGLAALEIPPTRVRHATEADVDRNDAALDRRRLPLGHLAGSLDLVEREPVERRVDLRRNPVVDARRRARGEGALELETLRPPGRRRRGAKAAVRRHDGAGEPALRRDESRRVRGRHVDARRGLRRLAGRDDRERDAIEAARRADEAQPRGIGIGRIGGLRAAERQRLPQLVQQGVGAGSRQPRLRSQLALEGQRQLNLQRQVGGIERFGEQRRFERTVVGPRPPLSVEAAPRRHRIFLGA